MTGRFAIPTALRNVRRTCQWRFQDIVNWHQLIQPLRHRNGDGAGWPFYRMACDMFTRFEIDYRPCRETPAAPPPAPEPLPAGLPGEPRVALFVDAPDHTSGVSTTLNQWARKARERGLALQVFSAGHRPVIPGSVCFPPMGELHVPLYNGLALPVPCAADAMNRLAARPFDLVHVSTPGPMGLLGLQAARAWGVPVVGTYHTDFPAYAARLGDQDGLEELVWSYMKWFYGTLDKVAAPSVATRRGLLLRGVPPCRVSVVGRGVDTSSFSPAYRDEGLRAQWGLRYPHKLLYVGRISEEKNLSCLAGAFKRLCRTRHDTCLVVVGEGPYQEAMARELAGLPVHFMGLRKGEDLARIYASCDLFVFPSETDTFGVVVIEAQASGLPVIVSDVGGPRDAVTDRVEGLVVPRISEERLAAAIDDLLSGDPEERRVMARAARRRSLDLTPDAAFERFWAFLRSAVPVPRPAETAALSEGPRQSPWRSGARSLAGV